MNGNYESYPQPEIKLPSNAIAGDQGDYWVELGDQRFSKHQWELIQLYAEGNHRARLMEERNPMQYVEMAQEERKRQIELGYDAAHDDVAGIQHLLAMAQQYHIAGDDKALAGLLQAAREYMVRNEGHTAQQQNAAFHDAFGIETWPWPRAIPVEDVPVVVELIREEFIDELIPALGFKAVFTPEGKFAELVQVSEPNVVEIYDAFIDILYVTYGGMNRAGMQAKPGYDEVQASNMSKLGADGKAIIAGPNDPDGIFEGRVKKGPNYFKPNLARVLSYQGWSGPAQQVDHGGFEDR